MDADFLAQLQSVGRGQAQDWLVLEQGIKRLGADVQRAIWAAAIPHWFDREYLNFLLAGSGVKPINDLKALAELSFIEPFPDSGFNVHEHSRLLLLKRLWHDDRETFIKLSRLAERFCAQKVDSEPIWQIELIYHSLTADPVAGVRLFASRVNEWRDAGLDEKVEILVRTALEVVEAGRMPSEMIKIIDTANAGVKLVYGWNKPGATSDQQLVERFLSGDPEAVATVDAWIRRAAWPYQRRLAGRFDDVLQNARYEVVRLLAKRSFKAESSLRTYLWRIVSHTCLDTLRHQSKWRWSDLDDLDDPDSVVRRHVDQESMDLPSEEKDLLVRVLERAPNECRELWRMMLLGLTFKEMSTRMGVSEGTIRVRVLRCRERATALRTEILGPQAKNRGSDRGFERGET